MKGGLGLTSRDVDGVPREPGALPHQTALLGQQRRDLAADELVACWLAAVGVWLAGVGHVPRAAGGAVVVGDGLRDRLVLCLLGVEGVAVRIRRAADRGFAGGGVGLEDCVCGAVDVAVDTQAEKMLVVVGVDLEEGVVVSRACCLLVLFVSSFVCRTNSLLGTLLFPILASPRRDSWRTC